MLIVAIAWIYVVVLMAMTEPTIVAGVMTLLLYCVVPLTILFYLTGSRGRKRRRAAAEQAARAAAVQTSTEAQTAPEADAKPLPPL